MSHTCWWLLFSYMCQKSQSAAVKSLLLPILTLKTFLAESSASYYSLKEVIRWVTEMMSVSLCLSLLWCSGWTKAWMASSCQGWSTWPQWCRLFGTTSEPSCRTGRTSIPTAGEENSVPGCHRVLSEISWSRSRRWQQHQETTSFTHVCVSVSCHLDYIWRL